MNEIFRPYLRQFVLVFFDDILVFSKNQQEHATHLKSVLEKLRHHKLYANRKKCEFGCSSIEYLRHVITTSGVEADKERLLQ